MVSVKKTYGVYNLMEWSILITIGTKPTRINFTGGLTSGAGVTPATYTTDNQIIQYFLEKSQFFKSGRIRLIRTVELPQVKETKAPVVESKEPMAVESKISEGEQLTSVPVSCADDAKDYLVSNFNISRNEIKTLSAIKKVAASHGVEFKGI